MQVITLIGNYMPLGPTQFFQSRRNFPVYH